MLIRIPGKHRQLTGYRALVADGDILYEHRIISGTEKQEVLYEKHALGLIVQGEKQVFEGAKTNRVSANYIVFFPRGYYVTSEVVSGELDYHSLIFVFEEREVQQFFTAYKTYLSGNTPASVPKWFSFRCSNRLQKFFEVLDDYFSGDSIHRRHLLRLKLFELFILAIEADTTGHFLQTLRAIYKGRQINLREFNAQLFYKGASLAELAKLSGRSLSVFKRDFKLEYKVSPQRWLREKRLDHAKFLLENSDMNVGEVSREVGYDSTSHFIKVFKQQYGNTPHQRKPLRD